MVCSVRIYVAPHFLEFAERPLYSVMVTSLTFTCASTLLTYPRRILSLSASLSFFVSSCSFLSVSDDFFVPENLQTKHPKREVKLPGKDYKSPQSFPFGTPYVEIRDFLANQNEELFRRNSVLGLLERDATTKRAPERWQALDSEEVASFDVVVCFESRVFDLVVEGTFLFALMLKGCSCAHVCLGFGSLVGSSCSGACTSSRRKSRSSSRSSSDGSSSSNSSSGRNRCSSCGTSSISRNTKSSSSSRGNSRKCRGGCSNSSSNSVTADAVEVGGLGAVGYEGVGRRVRQRHVSRLGLHIAVPSGRAPFYCQRKELCFTTPQGFGGVFERHANNMHSGPYLGSYDLFRCRMLSRFCRGLACTTIPQIIISLSRRKPGESVAIVG